jgi:phage/plasmid-like protein (TIGR03299 family)
VEKVQLYNPLNNNLIPSWGIFRKDNDHTYLGTVGDQYTPIQNKYAFTFVDTLLEADNSAHYVAAGALGNGERIWCLAKINGQSDITGTGDIHNHYLLFATSHDGSLAATCKLTSVRVVCNNTLNQAMRLNGEFTKIKHTTNAENKLNAAKKLITNAHIGIKELENKLRELSNRYITKDVYKDVMKRVFGDWETSKDRSVARIENKILDVTRLYESNDGNKFPEIRGTGYNLLNAITEYSDHLSNVRQTEGRSGMTESQIRSENALFGTGESFKTKAFEAVYEVVMKDGSTAKIPKVEYHTRMSGSVLDAIVDNTIIN